MAGMSISGLSSGLDTSSIIKQLMQLEALPQSALQTKLSKQESIVSALQGINAKLSSLATNAAALKAPDSLSVAKATSSDATAVTATASATTAATSLRFDVKDVAVAHRVGTGVITTAGTANHAFSVTVGGTQHDLTATTGSAADIAKAINDAELGVTAAPVRASATDFRLIVTADETGEDSAFTVAGLGTSSVLSTGTDARISLGTGFELTSSTNTFKDVAPGLDITVVKPATGLTVDVARDDAAVATKVKGLVTNLQTVLEDIAYRSRVGTDGKVSSAAVLAGDSLMRGLTGQLQDAVSGSVGGVPVGSAGISIDRSGAVSFDEAKFKAFLAKDPAKAQQFISGLAEKVEGIAKTASGATGTVTQTITSSQANVRSLNDSIDAWDVRLENRQVTLERQYAALETALQRSQSQSSWLAGALSGLPSWS